MTSSPAHSTSSDKDPLPSKSKPGFDARIGCSAEPNAQQSTISSAQAPVPSEIAPEETVIVEASTDPSPQRDVLVSPNLESSIVGKPLSSSVSTETTEVLTSVVIKKANADAKLETLSSQVAMFASPVMEEASLVKEGAVTVTRDVAPTDRAVSGATLQSSSLPVEDGLQKPLSDTNTNPTGQQSMPSKPPEDTWCAHAKGK